MLTPKQEQFAQNVASGKTQADAYRAAFNASKMKAETIQQSASRLMADRKVSARVKELREQVANRHLWTREDSVRVLREVAGSEKGSERVQAIKELNAMHGFNAPQKVELTGSEGGPIQTIDPTKLSPQALAELMAVRNAKG